MRKFKEKKILVSLYNLFTDLLFEQIFIFMPDRLKYVCVGTTQEIKHYLDKWNLNFSRAEIIVRLLSKTESSDQDQHLCWLKLIVLFSLVSTPSSDSSSSKYRLQLKYDHGREEYCGPALYLTDCSGLLTVAVLLFLFCDGKMSPLDSTDGQTSITCIACSTGDAEMVVITDSASVTVAKLINIIWNTNTLQASALEAR